MIARPFAEIASIGTAVPPGVLTNADLTRMFDTSDEWIVERTGIRQRHIAADGELTSDLAVAAAHRALAMAGLTPDDIDLIVVATATADQTFPACATVVRAAATMRSRSAPRARKASASSSSLASRAST